MTGLQDNGLAGLPRRPPSAVARGPVKAGATADSLRLSIGVEHIDDIVADLDQALVAV